MNTRTVQLSKQVQTCCSLAAYLDTSRHALRRAPRYCLPTSGPFKKTSMSLASERASPA